MSKKILVVDDDKDLLLSLKLGLDYLYGDIQVIALEDGEKCLEYLEQHSLPDLILLDIMMPGIDGWEVAAKIRANPSWDKITIFFVTAKIDAYSKAKGKVVVDKYITKPFDLKVLQEAVKKVLG